jgi:hypothetical protein
VFANALEQQGLCLNIWDLFEEWVRRSTRNVSFFYLKVHKGPELVGLGLFLRIRPVDLSTSYSLFRGSASWSKVAAVLSTLGGTCAYLTFRNLVTSNLARTFFCRASEMEDEVLAAILRWLKEQKDADLVSAVDTTAQHDVFMRAGFTAYPSSSEAFLEATKYRDVSEYLERHRSLRKNLARRKTRITTEVAWGPVSVEDRRQSMACVACSAGLSRVNTPCQQFFEDNIAGTEVFDSDKYLHIRIRVDGRIAGFHIFQVCGSHMGGVLGGFDRAYTRNNFVYERVVVASLDYAIKQGLERVHYSLVDNLTKLRLVESLEPCQVYFFSKSRLNRKAFDLTYRHSDMYQLYEMETGALEGKSPRSG